MRAPGPFLTAEWRNLAMLNWEIDPAALRPLVPRGTELDTWSGRTYVSLVGFMFLGTRVLGVAIPWHRDFEEVNLRFYVRREVGGEVRRGVVFVKELVPRWAIATVARVVYGENYRALPMRHAIDGGRVEYGWRHGRVDHLLWAEPTGEPASPAPGSEEEFITEHYWGYAAQRGGGTVEYRVEHPPWRVATVRAAGLEGDTRPLYGEVFGACVARAPLSAFVAEGSPIVVRRGRPL